LEDIECYTRSLNFKLYQEMGEPRPEDYRPRIKDLYEAVIYPIHDISMHHDVELKIDAEDEMAPLGAALPNERIILISPTISPPVNDPRYAFTAAHEIGHGIMHSTQLPLFRDTSRTLFEYSNSPLEREANQFASSILMPRGPLRYYFRECYGQLRPLVYSGPKTYCFTRHGIPQKVYFDSFGEFKWAAAVPLVKHFYNVSKEALAIRLCALDLVRCASGAKDGESHVSSIIADILGEF
jgi:hypothetical protein